jgi:hypothetical protein
MVTTVAETGAASTSTFHHDFSTSSYPKDDQ